MYIAKIILMIYSFLFLMKQLKSWFNYIYREFFFFKFNNNYCTLIILRYETDLQWRIYNLEM